MRDDSQGKDHFHRKIDHFLGKRPKERTTKDHQGVIQTICGLNEWRKWSFSKNPSISLPLSLSLSLSLDPTTPYSLPS